MAPDLTKEQAEIALAFTHKLIGLGIKAQLTRIEPGPVVTGYHFTLAHDVPINRILKRSEDFALAAACEKVTITRVAGEVVIYAANRNRLLVDFKDYLYWYSTAPEVRNMSIPIPLGVDTLGKKAALDLSEMPHLLLAGETGSGKSVFEAAIICSLSVIKEPSELEMYLVDTKQLDLPLFDTLPHVRQTVTTLREFHDLMDILLSVTYKRMEKLKGSAVRNINEYHSFVGEKKSMPFILVMIDEFGDLLEQDRAEKKAKATEIAELPKVETWLQRIVQISRAAGIHVIAGTQRTSVKIINGDIKTNFPCRISLRLPTEADSRTILGTGGAEYLLGKGDMLVQRPSTEVLQRYHGPFVDLGDIARITDEHQVLRDTFKSMSGISLGE